MSAPKSCVSSMHITVESNMLKDVLIDEFQDIVLPIAKNQIWNMMEYKLKTFKVYSLPYDFASKCNNSISLLEWQMTL